MTSPDNPLPVDLQALHAASLAATEQPMGPPWQLALEAGFGSVAHWRADLEARAQAPGVAWVVLAWRPAPGRLGHVLLPAGAAPPGRWPDAQVSQRHALLALTPQTLAAPLDWANVYARYQAAVQHDSTPWAAGRQQVGGAVLVDVRRAAVYAQAETQLPGAHWRNPAQVDQWAGTLPAGRPVLVYCVYGHEVSRATALRLRAAGVDARFLDGGLHAWQAAGGPLAPRPRG